MMKTGYSLAGLFALWALYESDLFAGAVCCSGSLWYPGWDDYVMKHKILKSDSLIYLCLGGKEEKTNNKEIAVIGDRTRSQEKILRKDPNVKSSVLEWNSGDILRIPENGWQRAWTGC